MASWIAPGENEYQTSNSLIVSVVAKRRFWSRLSLKSEYVSNHLCIYQTSDLEGQTSKSLIYLTLNQKSHLINQIQVQWVVMILFLLCHI